MDQNIKTDGTILLELLAERGISTRDFRRIYIEKANCAPNTANSFIQKNTQIISTPNLCLICALFGFSPADFGRPADAFSTHLSQKADREVYSYNYRDEGNLMYRPYMENFFITVNRYLPYTKQKLRISDYIGKFSGIQQKEHLEYYVKEATAYFQKIESRLADSPFTYARIFQLPLDSNIDDARSAKQFVAETLLPTTFAHLCRCLYRYQEQCEFYIVPRPFRMYSYYLMDERTIITEYNRFDKNGIPVPDLLFVNHGNQGDPQAVGNIYIKSCIDEFDRMADLNSQYRLNAYSLWTAVFELKTNKEVLKNEIQEAVKNVEAARVITPPGSTAYYEHTQKLEAHTLQLTVINTQIAKLDEKLGIWDEIAREKC